VSLGTVNGPQALALSGKAVTLGATNLASLAVAGTSIAISGVTTSGARNLTLSGGTVTLGPANLASLGVSGDIITTAGVTTAGAQSYCRPCGVGGAYGVSAFTIAGPTTLAGSTTVTATGSIQLGSVGGAQALSLAGKSIALSTANLASLATSADTILAGSVTTTGTQTYTGATTLGGGYGAS